MKLVLTERARHFWDGGANAVAADEATGGGAGGGARAYDAAAWARFEALSPRPPVLVDADEWGNGGGGDGGERAGGDGGGGAAAAAWKRVGDPVLHIELRKWADCLVVAPCSANTLAKVKVGSGGPVRLSYLGCRMGCLVRLYKVRSGCLMLWVVLRACVRSGPVVLCYGLSCVLV